MPEDKPPSGNVNISDISGGDIDIGNIITGTVAGDVVGRDKIVHNITNIVQQAVIAAEEAEKSRAIAAQRLAEGVRDYAQCLATISAQGTDAGGPYKGLLDYRLSDAELFFGRNRAIAELLQHLQRGPLTVLHAVSGAGKSSLLQAGISPYLLGAGHLPVTLRPYNISPGLKIKQTFLPNLADIPKLANAPLRDYLRQVTAVLGPSSTLYLLLDQFEETLTLLNETDRAAFVGDLADCLDDEALDVRWVLALRSEFFGDLANFRPRVRNPFENDYRLNRLSLTEARTVITEPATRQEIGFEPELVDALLNDLRGDDEEIAPPQIQLVCSALYDVLVERRADNPELPLTITKQMYQDEGEAQGILRGHLNRVLRRKLSKRERELARQLLIALVSADQRRIRRNRSDLAATLATYIVSAQSLDELLGQLVENRLLNVEKDEKTDEPSYELAHDYLLTEIDIDPEVQAQKAAQELLAQEVEAFKRYGTLLRADKFDIINSQRAFLTLDDNATELLRQSQAARRRAQLQKIGAVAVVVLLIIGAAIAIALIQSNAANEQKILASRAEAGEATAQAEAINARNAEKTAQAERDVAANQQATAEAASTLAIAEQERAELQAKIARSRQLAAQTKNELDKPNYELPLLLAVEAGRGADTAEPFAVLRQALARPGRTLGILTGHSDDVSQAVWNADETRILTASSDGTARVWDTESGDELLTLSGHSRGVNQAVWNADESHILTASDDGTARVWDADSGAELLILFHTTAVPEVEFYPDAVVQASWNADESRILTAGGDGTVVVWEAESGAELLSLAGHLGSVVQASWNADESRILTASSDGTVRVWDAETGAELFSLTGHSDDVNQAVWNADEGTQIVNR